LLLVPIEQEDVVFLLKLADLVGNGRLREEQRFGRARETAANGDMMKGAQLHVAHRRSLPAARRRAMTRVAINSTDRKVESRASAYERLILAMVPHSSANRRRPHSLAISLCSRCLSISSQFRLES